MPGLAVVVFSFGLRTPEEEPNPCNRRLAAAVQRLVAEEPVAVVVAQWEVASALPQELDPVVVHPEPTRRSYLDTDQVWQAALPVLHARGVDRVIAVAQPVLHRAKAYQLVRRSGFTPVRAPIGWIGFDSSRRNTQWWTRGPLRLALYALLQALTGRSGR